MTNISQPFWDIAQNCNEVPQGQVFTRHTPIFDSEAEPAIIYEGKEQSEWVKRYPNRMAIAKLSTNRWFEDGLTDAVCLKPEGEVKDLKTFETLGSKIINHYPGWRGREPIQNNLIDHPYYAEWAKYIVNNYSKELSEVELVGGIVASVGHYDFDVNFYKALMELWCPETNTFHFLHGEVGISLWDIKELGGLPIIGDIYDEVIPPNDIICRRHDPELYVLKNLFDIFQWLSKRSADQDLYFEDWVEFFYHSIPYSLLRRIDDNTSSIPGLLRIPKMLHFMNSTATPFVNPVYVRKFIRHEDNFISLPFPFMHHNDEIVRDSRYPAGPRVLDSYTMEYVKNLRCGVLPLRCAGDFFAEPYNQHRFGRQFGYDQHAPAYIDIPRRASSLGVLAGYWLHLSRQKTSSSFYILEHDRKERLILVYAQKKWLRTVEAFFQQSYSSLIQDDFRDKRDVNREQGRSSKSYRVINESVFIDHTDHTIDPVNPAKRQRTEGMSTLFIYLLFIIYF
ncbi:Protein-serine/threonine phosphatase protein [Dioscorea alata]|uniref:Protein-serine/threonine phosphatase protein n=1 Tax=Dioscorea alata TaxID=55571 RepID=A0ACB7V643_DIOAL|nr:Protein-serine/threonine phosphatase protein [Dioscorea alata]